MVDNIVGKGKNTGTGYQHFLLFQQCFQKDNKNLEFCGKDLTLSQTGPVFYVSAVQVF